MNEPHPQAPGSAQTDSAQVAESAQLAELQQLVAEMQARVGELRDNELDAATLEQRLRELNELATKAAGAIDAAGR